MTPGIPLMVQFHLYGEDEMHGVLGPGPLPPDSPPPPSRRDLEPEGVLLRSGSSEIPLSTGKGPAPWSS